MMFSIKNKQLKTRQGIISSMNSLQSASHVINLIVNQGKEIIYQNKVVKTMLSPYSAVNVQNTKQDIILQSGAKRQKSNMKQLINQIKSQEMPTKNQKDKYSFFSIKKCSPQKKQKQALSLVIQVNQKKGKSINTLKNNRKFKRNSFQNIQFNFFEQQDKQKGKEKEIGDQQQKLFKLQEKKQYVPKFKVKQQLHMNNLRQIKNNEITQRQTERQRNQNNSKLSIERQTKLKSYLQNHISRPNNSHTYDIQGNLLLFSHQNNKKAIHKAYPPTIRYQIQNQEQEQFRFQNKNRKSKQNRSVNQFNRKQNNRNNHYLRGAKGQIFKSSVLKTINLSRISLGNGPQSQFQFMKRNDLFNNNHCRQTTSIPFMKVQDGSFFKQTSTNQYIGKKDQQTQADSKYGTQNPKKFSKRSRSNQCRTRSQFKRYSSQKDTQSLAQFFTKDNKIYAGSAKNSKNIHSIGDTRYSSFYFKRPHTTQVGRINRQNQSLFNSLIQQ